MMEYHFKKGAWNPNDFIQVTSLRTDGRVPFMQEEDSIVNDTPKAKMMEHNYISLLTRDEYDLPLTAQTVCSFENFGAPLIVFSNDVHTTPDGFPVYGHHFEVVAFEEGINVWELNGAEKPIKRAFARFPVQANRPLTLTVKLAHGVLRADIDGQPLTAEIPTMPDRMRVGFTACEGVNRFYDFRIAENK